MTVGMIPDGTNWVDAYGRTWTSHGDDMVLWGPPTITIVGDNPASVVQFEEYVDAGATAVDAEGTDITGDIITVDPVDTDVAGEYHVTYTVTDSEGATSEADREVNVVDASSSSLRDLVFNLISAGAPEGFYVYRTPAEQVKLPCVVVGTMTWAPARQNSLKSLRWTGEIICMQTRSMPEYGVNDLETISIRVAELLVADGFIVTGFGGEGTSEVGGVEALTGTLEFDYMTNERVQVSDSWV